MTKNDNPLSLKEPESHHSDVKMIQMGIVEQKLKAYRALLQLVHLLLRAAKEGSKNI